MSTPMTARELRRVTAYALFVTFLFFFRACLSSDVFYARDILKVYYPLRHYWATRVASGEFPLWYPFDALGQPFVAMLISGPFHPSNLLYLLMPLGTALKVNVLVCYPAALLGTYLFARGRRMNPAPALLAGTLYAFCGYLVSMTNNLLYLEAAATFPWVWWAADRLLERPKFGWGVLTALLSALVLFAGDAQSFVVANAGVLVLAFVPVTSPLRTPTRLAVVGGVFVLTALLAAVQLAPAFYTLRHGAPARSSLDIAETWSLHPLRLLEMLVGPLFAMDSTSLDTSVVSRRLLKTGMSSLWAPSVYIGLPWLCAAAIAVVKGWRSRAMQVAVGAVALLVVLALGKFTPLYEAFFHYVPFWRSFRYPEKLVPFLTFLLVLGAGFGVQRAADEPQTRRLFGFTLLGAAAVTATLFFAESVYGAYSFKVVGKLWAGEPAPEALNSLHLIASSLLEQMVWLTLAVAVLFRISARAVPLSLALATATLWFHDQPLQEMTYPDIVTTPTSFVQNITQHENGLRLGEFRITSLIQVFHVPIDEKVGYEDMRPLVTATALEPSVSGLWGIESMGPYLPAASSGFRDFMALGSIASRNLVGLYNVKYATADATTYEKHSGRGDLVLHQHDAMGLLLLKSPSFQPRAYVAYPLCIQDEEVVKARLGARDFDLDKEALVFTPEPHPSCGLSHSLERAPGQVAIDRYAPERVELTASLTEPGLLVLNDAYYPGWEAWVNGAPHRIEQVNHLVRGLFLPAGDHHIEMKYRQPGLLPGALVSSVVAGVCAVGLCLPLIRRRRDKIRQSSALPATS